MGYPCKQVMTKIIEPGQWEEKEGYKQKQVAIHDIPFGYYYYNDGLDFSNKAEIMEWPIEWICEKVFVP